MALVSLGKNAVMLKRLPTAVATDQPDSVAKANDAISKTRGDIQQSLTPWIPGDFLLTYGTLLGAWTTLHNSFKWLLVVAILSSGLFVWAGAFSVDGFKTFDSALARKLVARSVVGAILSVVVATTVPSSGWFAFKWFANNQTSVISTLGIITTILVMILTGLKMRGVITTDG